MKVVNPRKALVLARKWKPIFIQEFKSPLDLICPIQLTESQIIPEEPEIYFSVKEDESFYYIFYMVYHYADYSDLPFLLKELDEHRHDDEGVLLAISKKYNSRMASASRAHSKILFDDSSRNFGNNEGKKWAATFYIEHGGHGINQYDIELNQHRHNSIRYKNYKLTNMHNQRVWKYLTKVVEPEFAKHGVSMPWRWNDNRLSRKYRKKSEGLIWNDPAKLFRLARKHGLM